MLPTLSGPQWQLLTVIVRQTLGWHNPATGRRKTSDWLSHRQLKARTGRGSEAVSHAVDALVRRELIEVRDEGGRLLATAEERRRSCSRLFYSLAPHLLARFQPPQSRPQMEGALDEPPDEASASVPVSRTGKPATTKETETNYLAQAFGKAGREHPSKIFTPFKVVRPEDNGCGCVRPPLPSSSPPDADGRLSPAAEPVPLGSELGAFCDFFHGRLNHHQGHPTEPPTLAASEQARLQAASERYDVRRLEQLAEVFFESDSRILHSHGYGLGAFFEVLPTLAVLKLRTSHTAAQQGVGAMPGTQAQEPYRRE